ncbi:FISUMP domain-containing protein [Fibrobacter sp. UWB10]|uniref:FISUMP domain-containing protein n=1 Tax=Fibrobacter sp. UWB10 TaxID=1896201 RepID=UPI0024031ED0|nr:FISUMP domain-containing protein [Fibrobacter sp. UWB10]SMP38097.1 major paralogous domain-containing protein [Fibrobacter sp. UWB10]
MKIFNALALSILLALLAACGDESSSSAPDPIGEISSSSNDDNGSSGKDKDASSSSQKDSKKSSSSAAEKNSSSSVSGKNSSSSVPNPVSSSEESFSGTPCEKDEEGYTVFISQEQVKYICQNGFWIPMSSSSVVQQSSSSKYYDMSRQFNAKLSYGEFTDPRDNHVYKTIRLYDDVTDTLTFFAENLNFGKMISGGNQQGDSTKYCYDDDPWYCENGWGGLYTWATAMGFPAVCDSSQLGSEKCPNTTDESRNTLVPNNSEYVVHRGICPEGWHIMNQGEWVAAINGHGAMNGSQYLSSEVWNGIMENPRGFSLLPAGSYDFTNGRFERIMEYGYYWIPREYSDEPEFLGSCTFVAHSSFNRYAEFEKKGALSIRCVKDY